METMPLPDAIDVLERYLPLLNGLERIALRTVLDELQDGPTTEDVGEMGDQLDAAQEEAESQRLAVDAARKLAAALAAQRGLQLSPRSAFAYGRLRGQLEQLQGEAVEPSPIDH